MSIGAPELGRDAVGQRRPKAPGAAALSFTLALALLVALIGIQSRSTPPPTVAQFAPQAVKQIKEAPKEQSSRFGEGDGEGIDGQGDLEGGTPPTTIATNERKPVTRRCVGDPPRQIEDSQSPPCVPFWQGNNGGATYKGVSADTIRIAVPRYSGAPADYDGMENFFNDRFEFYGRKLELVPLNDTSGSPDPVLQRNDARRADEMNVFASTAYAFDFYYMLELARLKVISVTSEPVFADKMLNDNAPYMWSYPMGYDTMFDSQGAWVCRRLAGKNADHAGVQYRNSTRVFGIVGYQIYPEIPIDTSNLERRMEGCDAKPVVVDKSANSGTAARPDVEANIVLKLKRNNVSTVLCQCDFAQVVQLFRQSTSQGYFPEWIFSTYGWGDFSYGIHTFNYDAAQIEHLFGITVNPRELRPENTPALWAIQEGRGDSDRVDKQTAGVIYTRRLAYRELLLIASGIQMAGPTLTPQTFEAGLQRTRFPNPKLPSRQGDVGFAGDHSMTDDAAEFYWHNQATSPYPDEVGRGAYCYVDHGDRRRRDTWPTGNIPYNDFPCDSRDQ